MLSFTLFCYISYSARPLLWNIDERKFVYDVFEKGCGGGGGVDNVINVVWKYSTTEIELNA